MIVGNVVIIGTSHIAKQSVKEIEAAFETHSPAVVAIELDRGRLEGLLHPQPPKIRLGDIRHLGVTGFLFSVIGAWAEKALGNQVGTKPGADMLHAVRLAQQRKIPVALVDQDVRVTLKALSKGITWREKGRFVIDIVKGVFGGKQQLPFDLSTVPNQEVIDLLIKDVRKRYPNVYRVLVHERNEVMAQRLAGLARRTQGKVVAIVGAGHKREIALMIRQQMA